MPPKDLPMNCPDPGEVLDGAFSFGMSRRRDERAERLAFYDGANVASAFEVEDEDGDVVFLAHGQGGHIHDGEVFGDRLGESEFVKASGTGVLDGVCGVHAIDLGGFHEQFALEFGGAEGGAGVGGAEGVAGAGDENDHASFLEMAQGASADERLSDSADIDGRHHTRIDANVKEGFFEGQPVHDGGKHAHLIGDRLVNMGGFGEARTTDEVASAHDNRDLHADEKCGLDFFSDSVEFRRVDAGVA